MPVFDYMTPPMVPGSHSTRVWIARAVAIAADATQLALAPFTVEGVFSPLADGIDFAVAVVITALLGFHIAFVPSFIIKVIPFADLAPTWTLAVLLATRNKTAADDELHPVKTVTSKPVQA